MNFDQLMNKIENRNPVVFGTIFSKSIELFKKIWLQGFVHLLLSVILIIPLIVILYVPIIALVGVEGFQESYGEYPNHLEGLSFGLIILFVLLVFIVSVIASAFQFGIIAHFYRVCKQVDMGEIETSDYFMFFKGKYLRKVMVISITIFGISLLAALLCFIPLLYVLVPLRILGVVFAFNPELDTSDLVKLSFKFGNKVWLTTLLLIFISSLLAQMIGFMMCFVGVFFTASFVYLPVYYLYKEVIGFETERSMEFNA